MKKSLHTTTTHSHHLPSTTHYSELNVSNIGTSSGVAVNICSGSQLATTLVDHYFHQSFSYSSIYFLCHNLFFRKNLTGAPTNLMLDPFPDPVGHFEVLLAAIFDFLAGSIFG